MYTVNDIIYCAQFIASVMERNESSLLRTYLQKIYLIRNNSEQIKLLKSNRSDVNDVIDLIKNNRLYTWKFFDALLNGYLFTDDPNCCEYTGMDLFTYDNLENYLMKRDKIAEVDRVFEELHINGSAYLNDRCTYIFRVWVDNHKESTINYIVGVNQIDYIIECCIQAFISGYYDLNNLKSVKSGF